MLSEYRREGYRFLILGGGGYPALVALGYGLGDGKTYAAAAGLPGAGLVRPVEALEKALGFIRIHMGFITKQGDQFYLSKDFAPLYRRWKQLREKHDAQMIANNAEHKEIIAELTEKQARESDAPSDLKQAARQARKEAKQAAKEARIEAYKRISEEKARARDLLDAKKEEIKAEKRMQSRKSKRQSPRRKNFCLLFKKKQ